MDFSSWLDKNQATELRRSKREVGASLSILSSPFFSFLYSLTAGKCDIFPQNILLSNLTLKFWRHGPHRVMCPLLIRVCFYPETIYFVPVQVQLILNELYLIYFPLSRFFFPQKSRFWGSPSTQCPENRENSTVSEFNEII